ncbi:hypothetical protein ACFX2I_036139 [Malus domestica]
MSVLLWKVKVDSYRRSLNTCREIFDKLFVIFVKLSVYVIGVDEAEKRLAPLRYLGSALRQIARDFRKAEFARDGC